jgi:hypothetical protein
VVLAEITTVTGPSLSVHILYVLLLSSWVDMPRIAARRIVAIMEPRKSVRNEIAGIQLICDAMSGGSPAQKGYGAVAAW